MAGELTNDGAALALDFLNGKSVTVGTVTVHLMSVMGTEAAGGTEVQGGSYAAKTLTMNDAVSADPATADSSALIEFPDMPATEVAGYEIRDGAVRLWSIPRAGGPATVNAGDTFQIPAGGLDLSMD